MNYFKIFKIEYDWYEGEHKETLIGKKVNETKFEKDLTKAKEFAIGLIGIKAKGDYLGKGYNVECLPEFYEQILWYLINQLGYIYCNYDDQTSYTIEDSHKKIYIVKKKSTIERKEM